jgi:hypothetical protein
MLCRAREKGEGVIAYLSRQSLEATILPQIEGTGHNLGRMRFSARTGTPFGDAILAGVCLLKQGFAGVG